MSLLIAPHLEPSRKEVDVLFCSAIAMLIRILLDLKVFSPRAEKEKEKSNGQSRRGLEH